MIPLTKEETIRYRNYIKDMERAIEIIRGDEPYLIKELMLKDIGMDRHTYGVVIYAVDEDLHLPQNDYNMLEWSITREIKSFKYALKNNYYENNTNTTSN